LTTDVLALPEARYQFEARQFAWPFRFSLVAAPERPLTQSHGTSRPQADFSFCNVSTEFFSRTNTREELASMAQLRDAKTLRLRNTRLAKKQVERSGANPAISPNAHN